MALTAQGHPIDVLVSQIIALASAGRIWPVAADADRAGIERVNAVFRRRTGTPDEIAFVMLPSGMAIEKEER